MNKAVVFHPVCEAFPLMDEDALGELTADIRANGLRESIWKHKSGAIIDGRNRHIACTRAGIAPKFRVYEGPDSNLPAFVVSLNIQRRHLNESQRAMVAAKLANLSKGQRSDEVQIGKSAYLPPVTIPQAAKLLNVGERTVKAARAVNEKGVPELAQAVERGDVAVSTAAAVAQLPPAGQRAALKKKPVPKTKRAKPVSDLTRALDEARAWMKRYAHLKPLAHVFAAITAVTRKVA